MAREVKEIKKLWNLSENLFSSKFNVGNFPFRRSKGMMGGRESSRVGESKVLVNSISRAF